MQKKTVSIKFSEEETETLVKEWLKFLDTQTDIRYNKNSLTSYCKNLIFKGLTS